jgi:hypothetical protein
MVEGEEKKNRREHLADVDRARMMKAHAAARCEHIRINGALCRCPAMKGKRFCYFHEKSRKRMKLKSLDVGSLEDHNSVQMAIQQVIRAVMMGLLDQKIAGLALYGLQTASANLAYCEFEPAAAETALDERGSTIDDLECFDPSCGDYGVGPQPKLIYREGPRKPQKLVAERLIAKLEELRRLSSEAKEQGIRSER